MPLGSRRPSLTTSLRTEEKRFTTDTDQFAFFFLHDKLQHHTLQHKCFSKLKLIHIQAGNTRWRRKNMKTRLILAAVANWLTDVDGVAAAKSGSPV
jgi:hypothetical protein